MSYIDFGNSSSIISSTLLKKNLYNVYPKPPSNGSGFPINGYVAQVYFINIENVYSMFYKDINQYVEGIQSYKSTSNVNLINSINDNITGYGTSSWGTYTTGNKILNYLEIDITTFIFSTNNITKVSTFSLKSRDFITII